jgi:phosphoglycerate dehydrogenase-like enzyme
MRVIAVREHAEKGKPDSVAEVFPVSRLDEMLRQADYVVLSAPLTAATTGLISSRQLRAMRPTSYLINVGRGPVIDEGALVEALQQKRIAGAGLDVFDKEPLPPDSPFWDLENVLITPHTAGMNRNLWERHFALFSENLRRFRQGQTLIGLVDKQTGY